MVFDPGNKKNKSQCAWEIPAGVLSLSLETGGRGQGPAGDGGHGAEADYLHLPEVPPVRPRRKGGGEVPNEQRLSN